MPLWPFCPSPGVTETLTWLTDVVESYSAQQAIQLRAAPRQGFAFEHTFTFRQYERAQLLMEYAAYGEWDLPVWHERQRVSVNSGVSVIPVDTTASDYREGGMCVLWQSDEACEALEIIAIAPGSLTVSSPTSRAYIDALVMPGRLARCIDGFRALRSVRPILSATVEWIVYEGVDLGNDSLYPAYRAHPVITDPPCIGGGTIELGVSRAQQVVDGQTGLPYFSAASDRVRRPLGMGWMVTTAADLWALRGFLHALKGRQKGFWLPSWSRGMRLAAAVSPASTTITIPAIGLNGVAESGDLMVRTTSGQQTFLRYTSVAPSGGNEVLTLSGAAGVAIDPGDVQTLCRMHFCRQTADLVQISHQHTGRGQVSTVMILAEEVPIP